MEAGEHADSRAALRALHVEAETVKADADAAAKVTAGACGHKQVLAGVEYPCLLQPDVHARPVFQAVSGGCSLCVLRGHSSLHAVVQASSKSGRGSKGADKTITSYALDIAKAKAPLKTEAWQVQHLHWVKPANAPKPPPMTGRPKKGAKAAAAAAAAAAGAAQEQEPAAEEAGAEGSATPLQPASAHEPVGEGLAA